jgi:hypothetical protein
MIYQDNSAGRAKDFLDNLVNVYTAALATTIAI